MNFLRFLVFILLFSCEDNFQEIQKINSKILLPLGNTENLKLIYTDSAKVKAILYSSLNKDFTNKTFPYSEFPNGIKISFFDKENNETIVNSNIFIKKNDHNIFITENKKNYLHLMAQKLKADIKTLTRAQKRTKFTGGASESDNPDWYFLYLIFPNEYRLYKVPSSDKCIRVTPSNPHKGAIDITEKDLQRYDLNGYRITKFDKDTKPMGVEQWM